MSEPSFELINPLILGLDVDSAEECLRLAQMLEGRVGALKIGPRLTMRYGADLVSRLAEFAPVFVDNKYLDIPNTMESAIRATFDSGATLATIHASAGPESLRRLSKVERELANRRPFRLLAVTVLTSFSQETLPRPLRSQPIAQQVEELAREVLECGLSGLVCSPQEVSSLRSLSQESLLVTPGVRLPTDSIGDQKRVETPSEAIRRGASALVVARPIIEAADPCEAAGRFLLSIQEGQKIQKGLKK